MQPLLPALVIGLAAALCSAVCSGVGLQGDAIAYGSVIAALVVRPDFSRWPLAIYPVLLALAAIGMGIGVAIGRGLAAVPQVFVFGLVAALMQLLSLTLPGKLRPLSGVLAVAGVLPLLGGNPSWSSWGEQLLALAIGLAVGTMRLPVCSDPCTQAADGAGEAEALEPPGTEPPLGTRVVRGLRSPYFWRKLVFASLALAIGEGVGAVTPKYLYFGIVLLLNESVGATLARVRDRMVGVSLGILMPLLVFNSFGISQLATGLVMGGTAALVVALNGGSYLRTALISSGVAFIGYGPLVAWYIPNRWIDYLMGCGLALAVGVLLFPHSALKRYNQLSSRPDPLSLEDQQELGRLLEEASEEARWLGLPAPLPRR